MSYVADLHTHSRFAIGTSRSLDFDALVRGAKTKGIDLLATADFTHPVWLEETRAALSETPDGLLELDGVSFVLGTEVNCTAQQGGRNRRVHILLFALQTSPPSTPSTPGWRPAAASTATGVPPCGCRPANFSPRRWTWTRGAS